MNANKTYFNGANAIVFDTETTNLDKPFCYNVGYKIIDSNGNTIVEHDFVVEQIWHNMPLFSTAYYANKRPLYVGRMRSRQTILDKWGYIMATMRREIKMHNVRYAYAYNAPFDDKVFTYNCDYYKTLNPLDTVEVIDIRALAMLALNNDYNFKVWCEEHEEFTESGNYSTTAETLFRYFSDDVSFEEEHTALSDSRIESDILLRLADEYNLDITQNLTAPKALWRNVEKTLNVKYNGDLVATYNYTTKRQTGDTLNLWNKTK